MKKNKNSKKWFNTFLVIVLLLILGGTGYMIYDSTQEPSFAGGGTGGGGSGGTTNSSPSTPTPDISSPIVEIADYYVYINEERGSKLELNADATLGENQIAEYMISLELSTGYVVAFGDSTNALSVYFENTESTDPYVATADGTHTFYLKTWQDGGISCYVEAPVVEEETPLVNKVESDLLKIRNMASSTDNEGNQVISFNYEVLPVEANDKSVTIDLSWTESSVEDSISEYLTYSHIESTYYVEVTMLQKANNQAKLMITSNANSSATATVYIDFEQEFLGWNGTQIISQKTLTLDSNEVLNGDDYFKQEALALSKGFLGTISIADKEITNIEMSLNSVAMVLNNPDVIPFINNVSEFNSVYEEARANNTSSVNFVNDLSVYIETLSDEDKATLRTSETATITAKYTITFDYYGTSHEFEYTFIDTFATSAFSSSTYVNVESITTEGNIVFK